MSDAVKEIERLRYALTLIVANVEDFPSNNYHLIVARAALAGNDPEKAWQAECRRFDKAREARSTAGRAGK